ncbi:DedA family protein [Streptomyces sp. NPDC057555]|uniref:DedA family protein n=1 Tax=Streptomyces sp. NPDC057555 TaxID=3346166 RepID=UPI0036949A6E
MTDLTDALGQIPAAAAYATLAAAVLAESVLLVGAFVPTLSLLLTAGALARAGQLNLLLVIAVAAGAVPVGDFLAHRTGRLLADRLRAGRAGRRVPAAAWRRAEALMCRRGGRAVFLARFVPLLRTLLPHLAGATRLPYRRLAPYSALAAPLWATAEAGTGYAAAPVLRRALTLAGPVLAAVALAAAGIAVVALTVRRHVRRRNRAGASGAPSTATPVHPADSSRSGANPPPTARDAVRDTTPCAAAVYDDAARAEVRSRTGGPV